MSSEQVPPETKGVTVELLQRLTLALRSRAWQGGIFECAE